MEAGRARLDLRGLQACESSEEGDAPTLRQGGDSETPGSSCLGKARSAPLLPVANSTQGLTWYAGACAQTAGARLSCWRPLGATWRDWGAGGGGAGARPATGSHFVQGCVPHWGRDAALRARGALEHELAWAYYRMRRHVQHPLRKQMGETLPQSDVIGGMRFGKGSEFNFWRDLRPPFFVLGIKRADAGREREGGVPQPHADGELYQVTYECGIEYCSEHMMGAKGEGGFYDNRIHSDALVRFSGDFPQRRPLHIVSWGRPVLNWAPSAEPEERPAVDPEIWMPIADELGVRPDAPSMKACRALTREANGRKSARDRRGIEVPELERLLLGPHASLPRLAAATHSHLTEGGAARAVAPGVRRKRSHTLCTSAAGFVRYAG